MCIMTKKPDHNTKKTHQNPGLFNNLYGWDGVGNGKEVQEGGDICVLLVDSCCVAETNIAL